MMDGSRHEESRFYSAEMGRMGWHYLPANGVPSWRLRRPGETELDITMWQSGEDWIGFQKRAYDTATLLWNAQSEEATWPRIIAYLAAHPTQHIELWNTGANRQVDGGDTDIRLYSSTAGNRNALDLVSLGDNPAAVVLAALANWTQANKGGK